MLRSLLEFFEKSTLPNFENASKRVEFFVTKFILCSCTFFGCLSGPPGRGSKGSRVSRVSLSSRVIRLHSRDIRGSGTCTEYYYLDPTRVVSLKYLF